MFELTNVQRKFLGMTQVKPSWDRIELIPGRYDARKNSAYFDGQVICKLISVGDNSYLEYDLNEETSDNRTILLPKTAKGKCMNLTAATLGKRTQKGMCFAYIKDYISLWNTEAERPYYNSDHEEINVNNLNDLSGWIDRWISDSTEADLDDISAFAALPKKHCKFREGDFFRFKLNRRLYGYGRILLDYHKMRKEKIEFWDILMGKPLVIKIYHIASTDKEVGMEELSRLESLPSEFIMHNAFLYGEYEIIGNLPLAASDMDFPIMYGNSISAANRNKVMLQSGRNYYEMNTRCAQYEVFINNGIGWSSGANLLILQACIECQSNTPYWTPNNYRANTDLRNPKFSAERDVICKQFNILGKDIFLGDCQ